MIQFKICKLCKEELSIDKFWKNPSVKDGFFNKCKSCANKTKDINKRLIQSKINTITIIVLLTLKISHSQK